MLKIFIMAMIVGYMHFQLGVVALILCLIIAGAKGKRGSGQRRRSAAQYNPVHNNKIVESYDGVIEPYVIY